MIGLDTNILARYYIDQGMADAKTHTQRQLAKTIIEHSSKLFVSNTVLIEFEWIMRGIYKLDKTVIIAVYENLLAIPNIFFENKSMLQKAIVFVKAGIEFTDAFHLASYQHCQKVYSFDDKGFARKVHKNQFSPTVIIPK